ARLQDELVAVGSEHRLALEASERFRPVAAAEEDELVGPARRHQRSRELDRDREHADPLRSPARGDVDRKSHGKTIKVSHRRPGSAWSRPAIEAGRQTFLVVRATENSPNRSGRG